MCTPTNSTLIPFMLSRGWGLCLRSFWQKLPVFEDCLFMGNCMEICSHRQQDEGGEGDFTGREGGCTVKILLTRKELEWLVAQLKEKGEQKLEDVLVEMEKEREKSRGWKPSLESIVEIPEVQGISDAAP